MAKGDTVRSVLRLTGAPAGLQDRAYRLAKADFSEGFCPVHRQRFTIRTDGHMRYAHCGWCHRRWGEPQEWGRP